MMSTPKPMSRRSASALPSGPRASAQTVSHGARPFRPAGAGDDPHRAGQRRGQRQGRAPFDKMLGGRENVIDEGIVRRTLRRPGGVEQDVDEPELHRTAPRDPRPRDQAQRVVQLFPQAAGAVSLRRPQNRPRDLDDVRRQRAVADGIRRRTRAGTVSRRSRRRRHRSCRAATSRAHRAVRKRAWVSPPARVRVRGCRPRRWPPRPNKSARRGPGTVCKGTPNLHLILSGFCRDLGSDQPAHERRRQRAVGLEAHGALRVS